MLEEEGPLTVPRWAGTVSAGTGTTLLPVPSHWQKCPPAMGTETVTVQ